MTTSAVTELLQQAKALRALARDLVGEGAADDVLQETAIAAMTAPPRRAGPVAGWLRSVVRHVASKHRRSARVRARHESAAARSGSVSPDGSAESADTLRRLTGIITSLPEPYRGTVLARYLRDRSPRQIAAETGTPVRTVKTRLQRALVLLRERLAERDQDWRPALAAAFGFGQATAAASTAATVLIMNTTTKVCLAAAGLLLAGLLVFEIARPALPPGESPTDPAGAVAQASRPVAAPDVRTEAEPQPAARTMPAGITAQGEGAVAADVVDPVVVLAVDAVSGAPIERFGVRVPMSPESRMAATIPLEHGGVHPQGRLVLPASAFDQRAFQLEASDGGHVPSRWFSLADAVARGSERVIEVRLVAPVEVEVSVVRTDGTPVAGSRVEVLRPWIACPVVTPQTNASSPESFRAQPGENETVMNFIGGRSLRLSSGTTDAHGKVVLPAPPGEPLALRMLGPGHRPSVHNQWVVERGPEPVRVVETVTSGATIRGRILPIETLRRLRPLPPLPANLSPLVASSCASGLVLRNKATNQSMPPQPGWLFAPAPVAEDGSFAIGGLDPGDWELTFGYPLRMQEPDARDPNGVFGGYCTVNVPVPDVNGLHDSELRVVDIDVSQMVPGRLEATVAGVERDLASQIVLILTGWPNAPRIPTPNLACDQQGRFTANLPPGRYQGCWRGNSRASLPLTDFEICPDATTHVDFIMAVTTASFRMFEADGVTPARGLVALTREGRKEMWGAKSRTDETGLAAFAMLPSGAALHVMFHFQLPADVDRKRVASISAEGTFGDTVDLGCVPAPTGSAEPIVLTLPAR
jgi:RNA polymerase sigma-70 factor (ECF subfamily)